MLVSCEGGGGGICGWGGGGGGGIMSPLSPPGISAYAFRSQSVHDRTVDGTVVDTVVLFSVFYLTHWCSLFNVVI